MKQMTMIIKQVQNFDFVFQIRLFSFLIFFLTANQIVFSENINQNLEQYIFYNNLADSLEKINYLGTEVFVQYYVNGNIKVKINGETIDNKRHGLGRLKKTVYLYNGYNKIEVAAVRTGDPWLSIGLFKVQKIAADESWEYSENRDGPWFKAVRLPNGNIWGTSENEVLYFRKKFVFISNKYIKRHNHIEIKTENSADFILNNKKIEKHKAFIQKGRNEIVCKVKSDNIDGFFIELRYLEQSLKNLIMATDKSWKWNDRGFESEDWKTPYIADLCYTVHGAACIWSKPYSRNIQYFKKEFLIFSNEASRKSYLRNQAKLEYARLERDKYFNRIKTWYAEEHSFNLDDYVFKNYKSFSDNFQTFHNYYLEDEYVKSYSDTFYYSTKKNAEFLVDLRSKEAEKSGKSLEELAANHIEDSDIQGKDTFIDGGAYASTEGEPIVPENPEELEEFNEEMGIDQEANDVIYLTNLKKRIEHLDFLYGKLKKNEDKKTRSEFNELLQQLETELEQLKNE